jgi:hypothetical protein
MRYSSLCRARFTFWIGMPLSGPILNPALAYQPGKLMASVTELPNKENLSSEGSPDQFERPGVNGSSFGNLDPSFRSFILLLLNVRTFNSRHTLDADSMYEAEYDASQLLSRSTATISFRIVSFDGAVFFFLKTSEV